MENPTWTDQLSAWSTFATAVFSFALVVLPLWAGRTAIRTLRASQGASEAAIASAEAARAANEQARFDSIEQTRPYVYAEVIPGLSGGSCYDLRLRNCGKSTARDVTLEYSNWPDKLDDVAESIKELFQTPRSLAAVLSDSCRLAT